MQIIMHKPHLLPGEASIYPQIRKSSFNNSESDMFQENQKVLIHFCINQREDIAWFFFGDKTRNQIGWPCKKIDEIWSLSVWYVEQFTYSGIISSHQHYVDSYSGEKHKEAM
jgi:hypothetical protein